MRSIAKKSLGCEDCGGACHISTIACSCGGKPVTFDSGAELVRYAALVQRQKRGEIRNLRRQVKYPLAIDGRPIKIRSPRYKNGRQCSYKLDFVYREPQEPPDSVWVTIFEEFKDYFTDDARLRIAVFEAQYNVQVRLTGAQKMRKRRKAA